jgi:hypothetical protein
MGRDREEGKRRGHAADKRRAAIYLAQLAWLADLDGTWTRLDSGADLEIDGALIAKTKRAARTVIREHPEALPKLVGDSERWWKIVDAKLRWCADRTTGFDPLPWLPPRVQRAIIELRDTAVGVAATRSAIAFVFDPIVVERLVTWLAAHRTVTLELDDPDRGWVWLSRLAVLGEHGKVRARGVEAIIAMLAIDAPDPIAALDLTRNIETRLRGNQQKQEATVPGRSRPRLVAWLRTLVTRSSDEQQRALELLAETRVAEALAPWADWERANAPLVKRARELADSSFDAWDRAPHVVKVIQKLEDARAGAPVAVAITDVLLELDMLMAERFERFRKPMLRMLRALPEALGPSARARWLLHAARSAATCNDDEHIEWVWDALADALEDSAPIGLLAPWQGALQSERRTYAENDLVEEAKRRGDAQRAVRVLVELAWRGDIGSEDCSRLHGWLVAGVTDEEVIAEVVKALRDVDNYHFEPCARAAVALAIEPTAAELARIGRAVLELTEEWRYDAIKRFAELAAHAKRTGGAWIVRAAVLAKQGDLLSDLGETLALVPRAKWPPFCTTPRNLSWIGRYPEALHPALRLLATVEPEAQKAAANRLADDVPDPAALEREIAALRERVGKPGVAKRLANLEARLASPKPPSPARLTKLAAKLERAAHDLGLARFGAVLTAGAHERLMRAFALPALPTWANSPRVGTLLVSLLKLDAADRELAARLVRARCGPPPWDLRDDVPNRNFLDELRAANIDPAPWLDDTPTKCTPNQGEPFALALTNDPIEVFAMGAHFETCLSPDGGNFFSVVANAADINKRVIYARRDGKVIGRCLLALTEAFAILAFQVYSHEPIALDDHVRTFILDLAKRMNTSVVPRGTVRLLLARDWYDDGPRDLVGRFRGLEEAGLDFDTVEPAAVVGVLRAALDRELDDVTLPIVLAHGGFQRRPELVIPLAPSLLASRVPLTRIQAAELALRAGDRALADRLLGDHARTVRLDDHPWHYGRTLAELRPSYTLARLRETRHRDVRSWEDDACDRTAVAGVAFEALHRPKQAAEMYRLAMREDWLAPFMRERLEALGEPVSE